MGDFFDFFRDHSTGVLVFLIFVVVSTGLLAWAVKKICWILEWGRFRPAAQQNMPAPVESSLGVVISAFFAKLIDEFRHLLALLIFLLFAGILVYGVAMAAYGLPNAGDLQQLARVRLDNIERVIQVIVASLGGLVGSIMGYYFGEARGKPAPATPVQGPPSPVQAQSSAVAPPPPPVQAQSTPVIPPPPPVQAQSGPVIPPTPSGQ